MRIGKVKMVDFKFIDLPGMWQHVSIPANQLNENQFEEGHGFDGVEHPWLRPHQ